MMVARRGAMIVVGCSGSVSSSLRMRCSSCSGGVFGSDTAIPRLWLDTVSTTALYRRPGVCAAPDPGS
jgi:hypothetical protein